MDGIVGQSRRTRKKYEARGNGIIVSIIARVSRSPVDSPDIRRHTGQRANVIGH